MLFRGHLIATELINRASENRPQIRTGNQVNIFPASVAESLNLRQVESSAIDSQGVITHGIIEILLPSDWES